MRKIEIWVNGERQVRVYRSTYSRGRCARSGSCFKTAPVVGGINWFSSAERAREHLKSKGFVPKEAA